MLHTFVLTKPFQLFKKIVAVFLRIIASGTSYNQPSYYNARLKGINCILLFSIVIQMVGLGMVAMNYPVSTEQYTQTFITVLINFLLIHFHYKRKFVLSEIIFASTLIVGTLVVQILYIITPFSVAIFILAAGMWHYNYVDNLKKSSYFMLLMLALSLTVQYGIKTHIFEPYIPPKSEVFNGNFASFFSLLFGVTFFVVNMRIYKNEIITSKANTKKLLVKRNKKTIPLLEQDILFLKADRNYVEIHMADGKQWVEKQSLSNFSKKLTPTNFVQIHKSYWINKSHITEVSKDEVIINEYALPVGRKFRPFLQS